VDHLSIPLSLLHHYLQLYKLLQIPTWDGELLILLVIGPYKTASTNTGFVGGVLVNLLGSLLLILMVVPRLLKNFIEWKSVVPVPRLSLVSIYFFSLIFLSFLIKFYFSFLLFSSLIFFPSLLPLPPILFDLFYFFHCLSFNYSFNLFCAYHVFFLVCLLLCYFLFLSFYLFFIFLYRLLRLSFYLPVLGFVV
jgi:hypothetical protein